MKRIGIDVGGTNTDAVLLSDGIVLDAIKRSTTADVTGGIRNVLTALIDRNPEAAAEVSAVIIGTTHFLNAIVERRRLSTVASIRLCLPDSTAVPPLVDWPEDLLNAVNGGTFLLPGGHEVDGREISPLDEDAIRDVGRQLASSGVESVAITSIFSPLRSDHEDRAETILREEVPSIHITKSSDLGRIGLLERENAAALNGALSALAKKTCGAFKAAIDDCGLGAELYLTQNDGTITPADTAMQFPISSIASGPTNSMRGASVLSGMDDAIVIDVGGTTADIGVLAKGFPREANTVVNIGGVRTLFKMPDVSCIALGGGTVVDPLAKKLGPQSVGFRLMEEATVFGGNTLTATDFAVALGWMDLGDKAAVTGIDRSSLDWFKVETKRLLETATDRMKSEAGDVRLIAVGGGAPLVRDNLSGVSDVCMIKHYDVANAVGAAIAQISGEVDKVFRDVSRQEAIDVATQSAREQAIRKGANPSSIDVIDVEDVPLSYVAGNSRRVRVRVTGSIE